MVTNMYVIYDRIAMESAHVFHHRNHAAAARAVAKVLEKEERPEDFELLCIGSFDHDKAKATILDIPEKVAVAVNRQFEVVKEKDLE